MPENKSKSGRFVAGKSGNPGGRPKIPEDIKMAFRALVPEAVEILGAIMRNPKEKAICRIEAIKTILDRAYGKPVQAQDISLDMAGSVDVTTQVRRVLVEMDNDRRGTEADN